MRVGPRAKLVFLMALFAAPIVASAVAYRFFRPPPTANYGELLLPPASAPEQAFERAGGERFAFSELRGTWALVVADGGSCPARCVDKLVTLRQVRLALGKDASRVARVFVVDDARRPDRGTLAPFEGTLVLAVPQGARLPDGAARDRRHIYLADPHGNVMMRWPASPDRRRMLKDLERLLKASQIG